MCRNRPLIRTQRLGDLAGAGARLARQVIEDVLPGHPWPDHRNHGCRLGLAANYSPGPQKPLTLVNKRRDGRDLALDLIDTALDLGERK